MAHPLLIALALLITSIDAYGPALTAAPAASALWTLTPLAVAWLATHLGIRAAARTIDRTGSRRALARAESLARALTLYLYIQAALAFIALDWLAAVRALTGDQILIDEALAATPFLLTLIAGWWSFAPIERRLIDATLIRALDESTPISPPPTPAQIVTDRVRHALSIGLVVIAAVIAWGESVSRAADRLHAQGAFPSDQTADLLTALAQLAVAIPVLITAPLLIRVLWDTVPLRNGPLHDRIAALADHHHVRFRNILVWRTRGAMLNGAVVGFIPKLRYVLLTDALIERLPADELDAVIAHEIAHVKRRHLPWLLASTAAAATLAGIAVSAAFAINPPTTAPPNALLRDAASLAASVAAAALAFGFVSRRFERQADAFAAQTLSAEAGSATITHAAAAAMSAALARVATLNHIPQTRFGYRHGSIARRIKNLRAAAGAPTRRAPIDRTVRTLKAATLAAFALALLAAFIL